MPFTVASDNVLADSYINPGKFYARHSSGTRAKAQHQPAHWWI
jgi:hypothetical protein